MAMNFGTSLTTSLTDGTSANSVTNAVSYTARQFLVKNTRLVV